MSRRSLLFVPLLALVLVAGVWLGGHPDLLPSFVRDSALVDRSPQARVFDEALDVLEEDYYRDVDRDKLLDEALAAAVDSLGDDFSAYFDPETFRHFQTATSGELEGVGMRAQSVPRGLEVVELFEGSPAARAGLEVGDTILAVDSTELEGKSTQAAVALIRGPRGTEVELRVEDDSGDVRTVSVERDRVDVPVTDSELRSVDGERVGVVSLSTFSSGAHGEVRQEVDDLLERGADSLVLDLRDNGGGLLNEAVLVSSIFIPEGEVVSTRGRSKPQRVFEATGSAIDTDIPVSVLVNEASASAAEIVAGAIQDRERGPVVGTKTFGKGVFQEVQQLPNGGALDITVGEYYTPDGTNLGGGGTRRGAGVQPDVRAADDPDTARDEALREALATAASADGS